MNLDVQYKLKSNPKFISYLRSNSFWYKELNRNPLAFKKFEQELKRMDSLEKTERIRKTLEMISVLENVITSIK